MSRQIPRACALVALSLIGADYAPRALAQAGPGIHEDNGGLNGSLSRGDLEKLGGNTKQGSADSARSKDIADSEPMANALQLSCRIIDANLVASGTSTPPSGGKPIPSRVYEVACDAGIGYLLEQQGDDRPIGISCLMAEEAREADVAKGKPPGFFCKLPENRDVFAAVTAQISASTGASCNVRQLQLYGHSASTLSDYNEVACTDGKGFMLRTPQPGSSANTLVMSCADATKQGIQCRLSDAGPIAAPVTSQTFKDALAAHGVGCNIDQIRLIGQEDHRKRYVVEYRCRDHADAEVAYLPLEGNPSPYESIGCAAAAMRGILCRISASP